MGQPSYLAKRHVQYLFSTLFLVFILLTGTAFAQQSLEIIPLQHRTVEQVLPSLQPLLEPGATLSGMNNQLFLRASPRNSAEIKQALAAIDTPSKRLLIRVSTDGNEVNRSRGGKITINSYNGNNQIRGHIHDSSTETTSTSMQMVQTIEGGRAFIQAGVSVAIPFQRIITTQNGLATEIHGIEYRDIGQGFFAEPRLNGPDRVTVIITQQADTPADPGPGSARTQRLSTSISGRLGEWMQLGRISQSANIRSRENISPSGEYMRGEQGIWLIVEEIR